MKRKIALFLSFILIAAIALGACANNEDLSLPEKYDEADVPAAATQGPAPNNDAAVVIMTVDGNEITKDRYQQTYSAICSQYGVAEDDPTYQSLFQQSALDLLLKEQVIRIKLTELGYMDLSEEDMALAEQQAQDELDYITMSAAEEITAGLPEDYTDEDMDAAVKQYEDDVLAQYDLTREDFLNYFIENIALDNAKKELLKDAVPSDEEVDISYENSVEADKTAIGDDLSVYDSYLTQYQETYYIPEGIRYVRHVLISLSDEQISEISTLRQNEDDEAADEARTTALASIDETANTVLGLLQSGDITFTDAIEEYGEDPGMESNPDGYEVYEGCSLYMQEFTDGAMSLGAVGDITGLVATDYGYHIIEYTSDRESGAIPFESVQQDIYDSLLSTKQDEAWQALVEDWTSQIEYTIFEDLL